MNGTRKYETHIGFIGPLTRKRTLIRERNKIKSQHKKEQKRLQSLCLNGTDNHNWLDWDCGCSFNSCGLCDKNQQCSICFKLR